MIELAIGAVIALIVKTSRKEKGISYREPYLKRKGFDLGYALGKNGDYKGREALLYNINSKGKLK